MMFSNEYCESFKNTIFIEHLWWLLLECFLTSNTGDLRNQNTLQIQNINTSGEKMYNKIF